MEENSKDAIKNFQPDEAEEDYATDKITDESVKQEENAEHAKKTSENLKNQAGQEKGKVTVPAINPLRLTLEQKLFLLPQSMEELKKNGLLQCEGYTGHTSYIPFKDKFNRVYLFEKEDGKDEYKLRFYANTNRRKIISKF